MASQARKGPLGAGRGSRGPPFLLTTPRGRFRCHMTVAGSDFVAATCRRGRKAFVLMTIRISRRAETRSDRTRRLREHPFRRGVNPPSRRQHDGSVPFQAPAAPPRRSSQVLWRWHGLTCPPAVPPRSPAGAGRRRPAVLPGDARPHCRPPVQRQARDGLSARLPARALRPHPPRDARWAAQRTPAPPAARLTGDGRVGLTHARARVRA